MRPTPRWWRATGIAAVVLLAIAVGYVALGSPIRAALRGPSQPGPASGEAPALAPPVSIGPPVGSAPPSAAAYAKGNTPSGLAMPDADLPGWSRSFSDDFTSDQLGSSWFAYTGENRYVTGGIALTDPHAQTYGRWDVRFRMQLGKGISYALLLWPKSNDAPPETDIAEDNGRLRDATYATLHPADHSTSIGRSVAGNFTQWHTIGLQWTPDLLLFTLDGREWTRMTGGVVPSQPMNLALQSQSWYCGHLWEACPDATTPPRVDLQVDWAVQYAWPG